MPDFIFVEDYRFEWPVRVTYPGASGEIRRDFTVTLRLPDEDELTRIFFPGRSEEDGPRDFASAVARDRASLAEVVVGWSGIALEGGAEYPYSSENLDKLLRQRPIRLALGEAASAAFFGVGGQREKN